ncbi:MAG: hypothetical protein WA269_13505, partial [Candidatus Udaeobacter sp.]
ERICGLRIPPVLGTLALVKESAEPQVVRCTRRSYVGQAQTFGCECMLRSNIARPTSNPPLNGFTVANILQA